MISKTQTAGPSLRDFERDISAVALRFTNGGVDPKARDFEDYANYLRYAAWRALQRCGAKAYVRRAIWNAAKDLARQARAYQNAIVLYEATLPEAQSTNPFGQVDARLDLQKVRSETPETFGELVCVLDAGSPCQALKDLGRSRSTLYRRHASNVDRARKVLETEGS